MRLLVICGNGWMSIIARLDRKAVEVDDEVLMDSVSVSFVWVFLMYFNTAKPIALFNIVQR